MITGAVQGMVTLLMVVGGLIVAGVIVYIVVRSSGAQRGY